MPLDGSGFIQGLLTHTVRGSGDTLSIFVFMSMFSNAVSSTYWVNRVYNVDYVFHIVSKTLANNQNQKNHKCVSLSFKTFPLPQLACSSQLKVQIIPTEDKNKRNNSLKLMDWSLYFFANITNYNVFVWDYFQSCINIYLCIVWLKHVSPGMWLSFCTTIQKLTTEGIRYIRLWLFRLVDSWFWSFFNGDLLTIICFVFFKK